jgi:hypothetical protein
MSDPLFKASNHHTASCGDPPAVDGDVARMYHGYFVNEHGEQAIYVHDRETDKATLRLGDSGWDANHPVVDGCVDGLKVTDGEATWIRACWIATHPPGK